MGTGAVGAGADVDAVVVGGGQAGLATGYHLQRSGLACVILDAAPRLGDAWRRRWEALPIGLTILGITLVGGLLLAVPRRALPLMPFVLALTGVTVVWLGAAVAAARAAMLPRARWSSPPSDSSASPSRPA